MWQTCYSAAPTIFQQHVFAATLWLGVGQLVTKLFVRQGEER